MGVRKTTVWVRKTTVGGMENYCGGSENYCGVSENYCGGSENYCGGSGVGLRNCLGMINRKMGGDKFYSHKTSPLILMQFQST